MHKSELKGIGIGFYYLQVAYFMAVDSVRDKMLSLPQMTFKRKLLL